MILKKPRFRSFLSRKKRVASACTDKTSDCGMPGIRLSGECMQDRKWPVSMHSVVIEPEFLGLMQMFLAAKMHQAAGWLEIHLGFGRALFPVLVEQLVDQGGDTIDLVRAEMA